MKPTIRRIPDLMTGAATRILRFLRGSTVVSLLIVAAVAGGLTGVVIAFALEKSELAVMVEQLGDYQASILSRVYADDGVTVIGEFYLERRVPIDYREIPEHTRQAFLAVEDARFYQHYGLDPISILRAFLANVREGRIVEGGSTITQQLAKRLFLSPEQTPTRKIKDALLALLIERYYTKEQILELYCNQIYLGENAYGVEAAAQYYFGKSARDLTLEESAMLAAVPKAPVSYSPVRNPNAARQRRNLVLQMMVEQGFITQAEADRASAQPITLSKRERISNNQSPYAYLVEAVRRELESKYGTRRTHTGGLQVYTTLDAKAQRAAVRAIRNGLHAYDRRHGWRDRLENILNQGKDLETYRHPDWDAEFEEGEYYTGLIMSVGDREAIARFGEYRARLKPADAPWWRSLKQLVRPGDLTVFRMNTIDRQTKQVEVTLLQMPAVQGALIAVEVPSGEVKAMVGGYDFNTSKFNHATQGNRQTGSAFKPFIYAAAVEYGLTPEDVVLDAPFKKGTYEPQNYDLTFKGPITIATAVAQSRNVPAVRVLDEIGIARATRMVERLGLPNPMAPYLSSALGATEEPLIDMVKAYSVFANVGRRVHPHFIRRVVNWDGSELERWEPPEQEQVLSPYIASTVVKLMQGVVNGGTAGSIRGYPDFSRWDIGGKTGTVNDFTDAWFIGYTPTVCAGVWIGFDEKRPLGNKEAGAVAALPAWIEFMKAYVKNQEPKRFRLVTDPPAQMAALQSQRRRERGVWVEGSGGQLLPIAETTPVLDPLAGVTSTGEGTAGNSTLHKILSPEHLSPSATQPSQPPAKKNEKKTRPRQVTVQRPATNNPQD